MRSTAPQDYTLSTFRALANTLIPPPTNQDELESTPGASDMCIYEYIVYALDHYIPIQTYVYQGNIPLALPTALMINEAARQYAYTNRPPFSYQQATQSNHHFFSSLSRQDRIQTLAHLEDLNLDLYTLPTPFQNNAGLIKHVTDALNRLTLFGYYSEWSSYGSTRLNPPDERYQEFFPLSWYHVGYPGVSLGYRDFRGFLLRIRRNEGGR
ncbi:hypothetical protein [Alkalibacillus aidingensis]|uniref:hypothetical protein n=1 Tax=Alkalibacillus aidingensis TaxID=2747607 RepID=UPI0016614B1B|nr:hypothetical protein [Alkalibacillus aidingensis]